MKIKYRLIIGIFLFTIMASTIPQMQAQEGIQDTEISQLQDEGHKYVMLATNINQLKTALSTAEKMDVKRKGYEFDVLISGILSRDLVSEKKQLKEDFKKFHKLGVNLIVCEIALDREKVNKKKLNRRIEIVPDTGDYLIALKSEGFQVLSNSE